MVATNTGNIGIICFALPETNLPAANYLENSKSKFLGQLNYGSPKSYFENDSIFSIMSARTIVDIEPITFNRTSSTELKKKDEAKGEEILNFASNLIGKSKNMESDFAEVVERRFWDMI